MQFKYSILWFSVSSSTETLCLLLDCLLTSENIPADSPREVYETYFVFACIWAFGGATYQDQVKLSVITVICVVISQSVMCWLRLMTASVFLALLCHIWYIKYVRKFHGHVKNVWKNGCHISLQLRDYRAEFSQWWTKEIRSIKLPAHGSVFDYYLDPQTRRFLPWADKIPSFYMDADQPLQVIEVIWHKKSFGVQEKFFFLLKVFF